MPLPLAAPLEMTRGQRSALEEIARASARQHREVLVAQALLLAADGVGTNEVARRMGVSVPTVRAWRSKFALEGMGWIGRVAPGRGRKVSLAPDLAERIVEATCTTRPPDGSTHWSSRGLAGELGVSRETVRRVWRAYGLTPWRLDTFKLSTDPNFTAKLVDVVGVYLEPPARAVVFAFDEKTQVQALDRTQPSLPMRRGRNQTRTHDYKRNGTVDLFAAMDLATGQITSQLRERHTQTDVLAFFKTLDRDVPRDLDIHVVLDNVSAHKAPEVTAWLARPRQARWHLHFTPTSASWLNLIERWFKELTDKRLRRGSFMNVAHLTDAINLWVEHWNTDPTPFRWTARPEDILAKIERARSALTDTQTNSVSDH
jgi:transposase